MAIPPLALRREQAAAALGISVDTFDEQVRPELRAVAFGRIRVYPVQRWLECHARRALER